MPISTDAPTSGTAGIAFVDCEISAGAGPSSGGGVRAHAHRRWEVVIAGKRIKTVDVHSHCVVPDAAKLINHPLEAPALLWSNVGDRGPSGRSDQRGQVPARERGCRPAVARSED